MLAQDLHLKDAKLISFTEHKDDRGIFFELYNPGYDFIDVTKSQDNVSHTNERGTVRGMHWQAKPSEQGKLVSVLQGAVYDVILDLRPTSITFGSHLGVILTGNKQLWVPPGFAHGFQTLTDNVLFHYKCSNPYSKDAERSLCPFDPILNDCFPIDISNISDKDKFASNWATVCEGINQEHPFKVDV